MLARPGARWLHETLEVSGRMDTHPVLDGVVCRRHALVSGIVDARPRINRTTCDYDWRAPAYTRDRHPKGDETVKAARASGSEVEPDRAKRESLRSRGWD
jgi:hypothetical protein